MLKHKIEDLWSLPLNSEAQKQFETDFSGPDDKRVYTHAHIWIHTYVY